VFALGKGAVVLVHLQRTLNLYSHRQTNMYNYLVLASLPLLSHAAYFDQQQKPLQEFGPDTVVPLNVSILRFNQNRSARKN
jgi:hypothetical protein